MFAISWNAPVSLKTQPNQPPEAAAQKLHHFQRGSKKSEKTKEDEAREMLDAASAMSCFTAASATSAPSPLDSLVEAQALIELREQEAPISDGSRSPSSGSSVADRGEPAPSDLTLTDLAAADTSSSDACSHCPPPPLLPPNLLIQQHVAALAAVQQVNAMALAAGLGAPSGLSNGTPATVPTPGPAPASGSMSLEQVALIDLQIKSMLQDYALTRAAVLSNALTSGVKPAASGPHTAARPTLSPAGPPDTKTAPGDEKVVPKRPRDDDPWTVRTWAIRGREPPTGGAGNRRAHWQSKRAKTDTSAAPPMPFGVHMVCLPANDSKEGGCGCRHAGPPVMEHNGLERPGEWFVVTQPHFKCPGGSFRPARFVPSCDATCCACECHSDDTIDSADCKCKGAWQRDGGDEWVKTTTAPTANGWKDRRAKARAAKKLTTTVAKAAEPAPVLIRPQ